MNGCWKYIHKAAIVALAGLAWTAGPEVRGQSSAAANSGLSLVPQPFGSTGGASGFGILPVPMATGTGTGTGPGASRSADPMGFGYVYGPAAMPMTQGQAGLMMLSASQRMLGLGNGQISGVRPAAGQSAASPRAAAGRRSGGGAERSALAAHTRNANVPGGQASRFFNRGTGAAATAHSQPYYNRQLRYFPQTGQ